MTFGQVVAMDSPSGRVPGEFNWGATLWHETVSYTHLDVYKRQAPGRCVGVGGRPRVSGAVCVDGVSGGIELCDVQHDALTCEAVCAENRQERKLTTDQRGFHGLKD